MSPTEPTNTGGPEAAENSESSIFHEGASSEANRTDRFRRLWEWALASGRIAWSDWRVRVGSIIVAFYLLMGTVGVVVVPQPTIGQGPRYVGVFQNMAYPLGTDNLGRGILAQVVHATPWMLKMIAAGAVFSIVVATAVGTVSGYKGGRVDRMLMTLTDMAMTIPGLPLVIVLAVLLQPSSPIVIGIVLTINAWAGLARSIRAQVLTIREESYIEASRAIGVPTYTIVREDILPNLMPYVMVNFVQAARGVIFSSVALYFLGILPTSKPNWGVMMSRAYSTAGALYTWDTAYWLIIPMVIVIMLVFGLILFAQGTDRLFNPRVRARHADSAAEPDSEETFDEDDTTTGMF